MRHACWRARPAIANFFWTRAIHASLATSRKDCFGATPEPARETRALPRESAQIIRHVWIFCRERFNVTDFFVNSFYARPFGARAEEPAPKAFGDDARSVESVAGDQSCTH